MKIDCAISTLVSQRIKIPWDCKANRNITSSNYIFFRALSISGLSFEMCYIICVALVDTPVTVWRMVLDVTDR
jgi:hypothetical protein